MKKRINRTRRRTIHFHVHGSTGYYNYVTCNAKELSHVLNMHSLPQLSFQANLSLSPLTVASSRRLLEKGTSTDSTKQQSLKDYWVRPEFILLPQSSSERGGRGRGKKSKRGWYPSLLRVFSFKKSKARFLRYILGFRADKCQW